MTTIVLLSFIAGLNTAMALYLKNTRMMFVHAFMTVLCFIVIYNLW